MISDFGLSKNTEIKSKRDSSLAFIGTPNWMAPEIIRRNASYSSKVDIWALGALVLEMLTGLPPWHDTERTNLIFRIGRGDIPSLPQDLSEIALLFIGTAFTIEPTERPSATQLLKHDFVKIDMENVQFKEWISMKQKMLLELELSDSSSVYIDCEDGISDGCESGQNE